MDNAVSSDKSSELSQPSRVPMLKIRSSDSSGEVVKVQAHSTSHSLVEDQSGQSPYQQLPFVDQGSSTIVYPDGIRPTYEHLQEQNLQVPYNYHAEAYSISRNPGYGTSESLTMSQVQQKIAQMRNMLLERRESAARGSVSEETLSGVSFETIKELEDLLTNLNPFAKEFVPPSASPFLDANQNRFQKRTFPPGKPVKSGQQFVTSNREESVRRTVYVSDIDQQVTEEQLAALFITCGQVVDCRICGDPNSVLRFAFVEFSDEEGARNALNLAGTVLGYYPVRVLPSKTAIVPVNPTLLPRSESERDLCARTVYCANIDKKVTQADVRLFFESLCGEVSKLRLLGDYHHSTRIAFVEFVMAESAMAALNCSGAILGSLPIRVSPSKTPVRPRAPKNNGTR